MATPDHSCQPHIVRLHRWRRALMGWIPSLLGVVGAWVLWLLLGSPRYEIAWWWALLLALGVYVLFIALWALAFLIQDRIRIRFRRRHRP